MNYKNCAIYTRVSTDNQAEKEFSSCEAQEQKIKSFIASQNNWQVFKVYNDAGYSGATLQRPALQELLSDLKKEKIDVVLVYKIDRLTRSPKDFYQLIEFFKQAKIDAILLLSLYFHDEARLAKLLCKTGIRRKIGKFLYGKFRTDRG